MARMRSLIAIWLALVLIVSPASLSYADGGNENEIGGNNPIDGHPWDDEATETDPDGDNDPNTPGESVVDVPPNPLTPSAASLSNSGVALIDLMVRTFVNSWIRISETKASKSKVATARTKRMR